MNLICFKNHGTQIDIIANDLVIQTYQRQKIFIKYLNRALLYEQFDLKF